MEVKEIVFESLENARDNEYDVFDDMDTIEICRDLCSYVKELECLEPDSLVDFVIEWRDTKA